LEYQFDEVGLPATGGFSRRPMEMFRDHVFATFWFEKFALERATHIVPVFDGAARASLLSTWEPVVTVILAVVLLGDRFSITQVAGGVLILGAVIVVQSVRSGGQTVAESRQDRV